MIRYEWHVLEMEANGEDIYENAAHNTLADALRYRGASDRKCLIELVRDMIDGETVMDRQFADLDLETWSLPERFGDSGGENNRARVPIRFYQEVRQQAFIASEERIKTRRHSFRKRISITPRPLDALEMDLHDWFIMQNLDPVSPEEVNLSWWDTLINKEKDPLKIGKLVLQRRWIADWMSRYERRFTDNGGTQ